MNKIDLFFVVILGLSAIAWGADAFISADDIDDSEGKIKVKPSKYKGLVDYLKKRWHDKYRKKIESDGYLNIKQMEKSKNKTRKNEINKHRKNRNS